MAWRPIKILPNDQSVVGKIVRPQGYNENLKLKILHVGNSTVLISDTSYTAERAYPPEEWAEHLHVDWLEEVPDEPVKETKLVSPLIRINTNGATIERSLPQYKHDFENDIILKPGEFVQWPARVVLKNVKVRKSEARIVPLNDGPTDTIDMNDLEAELWFEVQQEVRNERD